MVAHATGCQRVCVNAEEVIALVELDVGCVAAEARVEGLARSHNQHQNVIVL